MSILESSNQYIADTREIASKYLDALKSISPHKFVDCYISANRISATFYITLIGIKFIILASIDDSKQKAAFIFTDDKKHIGLELNCLNLDDIKSLLVGDGDTKISTCRKIVRFIHNNTSIIYHEFVHYADYTRNYLRTSEGNVKENTKVKSTDPDAGYYNSDPEFNARFTSAVEDAINSDEAYSFTVFKNAILRNSQLNDSNGSLLSGEMYKKLLKRIYQVFNSLPKDEYALTESIVDAPISRLISIIEANATDDNAELFIPLIESYCEHNQLDMVLTEASFNEFARKHGGKVKALMAGLMLLASVSHAATGATVQHDTHHNTKASTEMSSGNNGDADAHKLIDLLKNDKVGDNDLYKQFDHMKSHAKDPGYMDAMHKVMNSAGINIDKVFDQHDTHHIDKSSVINDLKHGIESTDYNAVKSQGLDSLRSVGITSDDLSKLNLKIDIQENPQTGHSIFKLISI